MRYLIKYKIFDNKSILLDLTDNVDRELVGLIQSLIKPGTKILEISCGNGADAIELTKLGYSVHSTDYDDDYIKHVNKSIGSCIKLDTRNEFPYGDREFNLVYSRLGLHYFTPVELEGIFDEISRVTKKYLVFTVKLANDHLATGKIILTKNSWEELVSNNFEIISSKEKIGILYGNESTWLEIVAEKK